MKNAPNVKVLPKDKYTEAIIFAGSDAFAHAQHWIESEGKRAGDTTAPVYLGKKHLAELENLRIVDEGRHSVRVYRSGEISEVQLSTIATLLAVAGVTEARLFDGICEQNLAEDWTTELARLKKQVESGESTVLRNPVKKQGGDKVKPGEELKPRVESRSDGVFWVTPKVDKESGEIIHPEAWLCSALDIIGAGTVQKERYLIFRWKEPGTTGEVTRAIPKADIGEREGWRTLKAGGVSVTTKTGLRAILSDWLQQCETGQEWHICHTTGWHHGAYIMPDGDIIGEPESPVLFHGRSAAASGYTVKGTPESWRDSIGRLAGGNPSMMLGVAAALSAPLIGLVQADGFGVHLFEQSSAGKTTTANIASSLYGEPDALRLTWYGTALGIANEAESHNDSLLPLDEVGQGSSAKDVATSAYTLFNGAGKLQGAKEGGNRDLKRWRTVAISTGEMDIETYLKTGGLNVKAGQLVRLLNVPMEKSTVFHEHQTGKQHADALRDAWQANHGAAGREWVRYLATHQQEAKDAVRTAQQRWRTLLPVDYGEQVHRVAERFAIMEAALILGNVVTGWDAQLSRDAIQHCFNAWVKEFGTGNKEHQQIIEQAEAFLNAYGMSRFAPIKYDPRDLPISELMGYRDNGERFDDPTLFYVLPAPFKNQIAKDLNKDTVARILHEAGMLKKPVSGGWQIRTPRLKHLNNTRQRTYVLLFAPETDEPES